MINEKLLKEAFEAGYRARRKIINEAIISTFRNDDGYGYVIADSVDTKITLSSSHGTENLSICDMGAGYILENGNIFRLDWDDNLTDGMTHYDIKRIKNEVGQQILNSNLPEWSTHHPYDDTCIRVFKQPNKNQYETIEKIADWCFDNWEWCKLEIENNFYEVYATNDRHPCIKDYPETIVNNWTGYDIVRKIKNYYLKK